MAQLVMENESLRRKHKKVQQRRDHYARLYYRCQAELDKKRWELHSAKGQIRDLRDQSKCVWTLIFAPYRLFFLGKGSHRLRY